MRLGWSISLVIATITAIFASSHAAAVGTSGYYRMPAIHDDQVVFVAEGDLWRVDADGGVASRLTTHHGPELHPAISPDGTTVAFTAQYDGPTEVYTMPLDGGLPVRRTFDAARCTVQGFMPDGRLLFATSARAPLRDLQLVAMNLETGEREQIPLSQASQGAAADGVLYFTRFTFQGSHTKRYRGGTAEQLWRFTLGGSDEAVPLTTDYAGTSRDPMTWNGRVYFVSDRDDTMNIWSMRPDGTDLRQHTRYVGLDAKSADLSNGQIIYQHGADLHVLDIRTSQVRTLTITLGSDFDQMREKWIDEPAGWVTAAHPSPDGDRVVLTARGDVFVAPRKHGRLIAVAEASSIRFRGARFMPDGERLIALSDESGEIELWDLPANGIGDRRQITRDGSVLRWDAIPSPDGSKIAHHDKDRQLWVMDVATGESQLVDTAIAIWDAFSDLTWSPDSRWLAYVVPAKNTHRQLRIFNTDNGTTTNVTSDRYDSYAPAWSTDGAWLYMLSDRTLRTRVGSPWGPRHPEPYFDRTTRIYAIALQPGLRSPFMPDDELIKAASDSADKPSDDENPEATNADADADAASENGDDAAATNDETENGAELIEIVTDGLAQRLHTVPVAPGNYTSLLATEKHLYWVAAGSGPGASRDLMVMKIENVDPKPKKAIEGIGGGGVQLSADRSTLMVRKGSSWHLVKADGSPSKLDKTVVDLNGWTFAVDPTAEWRQMFFDAWRLERDYFYDRGMHGVDWPAMREKYEPLVDRVRDRAELGDLISQMVAELSALHIFVRGGDHRSGDEQVAAGSLGARIVFDPDADGHRIEHMFAFDPDEPDRRPPLARLDLDVSEGDVIVSINGVSTATVHDLGVLLRNTVGRQVLLDIRDAETGDTKSIVVTPISTAAEAEMRYHEWEYTRRLAVERQSDGRLGYVHLRAMGAGDYNQWARDFYPVHDRAGLILDVRHNRGGNIDSWILSRLLRQSWMYWSGRDGEPSWNMQQSFRGHMILICDERTASDGEAISEGFRRLGLGPVIGTRTWGGEIWLSSSNFLVDRGIATAAEFGVYGPEGAWLIEGHGVEPDIVVDNLPHATFNGSDVQLDTAIRMLLEQVEADPRDVPRPPAGPDKSSSDNSAR